MTKKASYRTLPLVNRSSDDNSSIFNEFSKNLEKISVQPYREERESFQDQIYSIINGKKPKYSSVEDAVKDMQARSGLTAYQKKLSIKEIAQKISEAADKFPSPKVFDMNTSIKNTVDNIIQDTKGNMSIPAILEKTKSIHKIDVSDDGVWRDEELLKYINEKNIEQKRNYPTNNSHDMNLGKMHNFDDKDVDQYNSDALFSLSPAVLK